MHILASGRVGGTSLWARYSSKSENAAPYPKKVKGTINLVYVQF